MLFRASQQRTPSDGTLQQLAAMRRTPLRRSTLDEHRPFLLAIFGSDGGYVCQKPLRARFCALKLIAGVPPTVPNVRIARQAPRRDVARLPTAEKSWEILPPLPVPSAAAKFFHPWPAAASDPPVPLPTAQAQSPPRAAATPAA